MEFSNTKPHVALLSSPAHLTPMVELGKRLVTYQNVKVTTFVTSFLGSAATISRMVQSAQSEKLFDVIQLPPADISGLISPGQTGLASLPAVVRVSEPAFRSAICALETPPTALVAHVYAVDCLGIADELKIPKFVYMSSHAWYLALFLYVPILDKNVGGELGDDDQKEPFVLPGCTPVRPEDLPDPMLVQTKNNYLELIRMATEIPKADGILVNTWEELQPTTLAALRDDKLLGSVAKAPIFPIGPVTAEGAVGSKSELSGWLDKQPNESVLYISFGSMGALSLEQMTELAWGLELSQQRFIWVVRPPTTKTGIGSVPKFGFDVNDTSTYLPEGFMSRTHGKGLVVPQWAPQVEILSHPSCGGFFTHCGWNSAMECISNGLPMIAWPLYAEQRMNATMLTEELGIAVRSKTLPSKGVVGREEIETMVKKIFVDEEGGKIRGRVKELKLSAEKAWSQGGSSYNALAEMVKQCT
ncbi:UDP-glucuronosyl/UDP-glucosyltransferase - like 6 [Theobroma cacao]|nr:UDP-glucuronosyl/UDP-glucosyltransferase - like 6 [Theobroma cacao]